MCNDVEVCHIDQGIRNHTLHIRDGLGRWAMHIRKQAPSVAPARASTYTGGCPMLAPTIFSIMTIKARDNRKSRKGKFVGFVGVPVPHDSGHALHEVPVPAQRPSGGRKRTGSLPRRPASSSVGHATQLPVQVARHHVACRQMGGAAACGVACRRQQRQCSTACSSQCLLVGWRLSHSLQQY